MLNTTEFKTIIDVVTRFPTEKSCHQYLASRRWSDGVMLCPHEGCKGEEAYVFKDGIRYKCKCCNRLYNAKTGTFMEGSNLATIKWFVSIFMVLHKKGISSMQLAKDVGVTQKTAWFILHRLRAALGNVVEVELEGSVQLDETFVGGKNKNRHADKKVKNSQGRSFKDKTPVMGMLEQQEVEYIERPHKVIPGRTVKEKIVIKPSHLVCHVVADTKMQTLQPIIRAAVKKGSILISDEWFAYRGLNNAYTHHVVDHAAKNYVTEDGFTSNALEGSWAQLKRSIIGIYHKTSRKHLHRYVSEFTFRYNNRTLKAQPQFDCVIANMEIRLKYKDLVA